MDDPPDMEAMKPEPSCRSGTVAPLGAGFFTDISEQSGIRVGNYTPMPPMPIPINDHSRLGFVDLNGDGYDDIVMHSLFPNPQKGIPFEHLVFLNNRDGTFRDAVNAADDRRDFRNERAELIEENNLLIELERTASAELTWGPQMQILVRARQIMTRFIDLSRIELARSRQELREDRRELREDRRPWNR